MHKHICTPSHPANSSSHVFSGLMFFFPTNPSGLIWWVSDMNKLVSQGTGVMETDYSCISIETPSQGIEHPIALYTRNY